MWQDAFSDRLVRDQRLSELTTVRVGGPARCLVRPRDDADVGLLLEALHREGVASRVLGGGSNLLAPDGGVDGVVIHPSSLTDFRVEGERIHVGAGLPLATLVSRANDAGLAGAHVLAGIPGQTGGAIVMNAGGRYGEIAEIVETVHLRLADGDAVSLDPAEVSFAYRSTLLPVGAVVTGAVLRLRALADRRALKRESGRIQKEKNRAQPTTRFSFGCMFKNPPGASAGVLIERAGLKGHAVGGARISPLHGNFVENLGEARAADIRALMAVATEKVVEMLGVRLEPEVRVWPD